ncbi:hypothetical protein I3843_15G101300 [Carya illinoinensis]|uniref:Uncharacterized protein n=1 Tax=Carya illinoinensis TaxID=32201 RepID=A0A922DB66_CARIL|nr:hypothetical protein I3842_15G107100 [Carya illinoinensis]KAG7944420.1 hypothetical protein I3843_15G101300 [Carya illinoinensis]
MAGTSTPCIECCMKERFKAVMAAGENAKNQPQTAPTPKLQKVKFLLRDNKNFAKFYEPRVVSLGPIHHGKEKYRLGEKYKLGLTKDFVTESCENVTIEDLYKKIEEEIKALRECFEEEVTKPYDNGGLAWILFVDGCAVLQYIYYAVKEKFTEKSIKRASVAFWQQDLFLLENQLPYRLLESLMSLSKMKGKFRSSIRDFIKKNHNMVLEGGQQLPGNRERSEDSEPPPTHLLDLLRTSLLGPPGSQTKTKKSKIERKDPEWQSYRNLQELKAAGIIVKRSCIKTGNYLRSISFARKWINLLPGKYFNLHTGHISLPPMIVDDSTRPKFLNMIAYEMCLDFYNDFGVTSYISFLDSLIDEASDVKDLRKARVLYNFLGSDEEVAQLFNEIGTDLVPDLKAYKDVKYQIQECYDNTWMKFTAEFFHYHFRNSWTGLASLGALFALFLGATQTWFAVFSPDDCNDFCKKFTQNL